MSGESKQDMSVKPKRPIREALEELKERFIRELGGKNADRKGFKDALNQLRVDINGRLEQQLRREREAAARSLAAAKDKAADPEGYRRRQFEKYLKIECPKHGKKCVQMRETRWGRDYICGEDKHNLHEEQDPQHERIWELMRDHPGMTEDNAWIYMQGPSENPHDYQPWKRLVGDSLYEAGTGRRIGSKNIYEIVDEEFQKESSRLCTVNWEIADTYSRLYIQRMLYKLCYKQLQDPVHYKHLEDPRQKENVKMAKIDEIRANKKYIVKACHYMTCVQLNMFGWGEHNSDERMFNEEGLPPLFGLRSDGSMLDLLKQLLRDHLQYFCVRLTRTTQRILIENNARQVPSLPLHQRLLWWWGLYVGNEAIQELKTLLNRPHGKYTTIARFIDDYTGRLENAVNDRATKRIDKIHGEIAAVLWANFEFTPEAEAGIRGHLAAYEYKSEAEQKEQEQKRKDDQRKKILEDNAVIRPLVEAKDDLEAQEIAIRTILSAATFPPPNVLPPSIDGMQLYTDMWKNECIRRGITPNQLPNNVSADLKKKYRSAYIAYLLAENVPTENVPEEVRDSYQKHKLINDSLERELDPALVDESIRGKYKTKLFKKLFADERYDTPNTWQPASRLWYRHKLFRTWQRRQRKDIPEHLRGDYEAYLEEQAIREYRRKREERVRQYMERDGGLVTEITGQKRGLSRSDHVQGEAKRRRDDGDEENVRRAYGDDDYDSFQSILDSFGR